MLVEVVCEGLYQEHVSASTSQGAKVRRLSCLGAGHYFTGFLNLINFEENIKKIACSLSNKSKENHAVCVSVRASFTHSGRTGCTGSLQ